jgi:hypothetical protein
LCVFLGSQSGVGPLAHDGVQCDGGVQVIREEKDAASLGGSGGKTKLMPSPPTALCYDTFPPPIALCETSVPPPAPARISSFLGASRDCSMRRILIFKVCCVSVHIFM